MTDYCTLNQIKSRLQIDQEDRDQDAELREIRDDQEAIIDEALEDYVTTPLTTVPKSISEICADLCRIEARYRRTSESAAATHYPNMRKAAMERLQDYIKAKYGEKQIAFIVGTDET